jgi:hypothetical protein
LNYDPARGVSISQEQGVSLTGISNIEIINKLGNFEHVLSASQFSFFQIVMRELGGFFKRTMFIKKLPIKSQQEIDAIKKLNPKHAEFQQFMLDNYKKYEGGTLN